MTQSARQRHQTGPLWCVRTNLPPPASFWAFGSFSSLGAGRGPSLELFGVPLLSCSASHRSSAALSLSSSLKHPEDTSIRHSHCIFLCYASNSQCHADNLTGDFFHPLQGQIPSSPGFTLGVSSESLPHIFSPLCTDVQQLGVSPGNKPPSLFCLGRSGASPGLVPVVFLQSIVSLGWLKRLERGGRWEGGSCT